jgi:chitin disaccharide deacetylase
MVSLAERLGFAPDAKLLIVNCDDLGSSASANRAIGEVIRRGAATSATLMVPCPWALDGVRRAEDGGIGVHLTLTAEYPAYRWRSLTGAASLHDTAGYFPATAQAVWERADLADVRAECRAQVEQAYAWGVDVTHLDTHMGVMQLERRYFEVFLDLAAEYRLPIRMFGARTEDRLGFAARAAARAEGILCPDHMIDVFGRPRGSVAERLATLRPGVTELFLHPVEDGPELRAYDQREAEIRVGDYAEMLSPAFGELLDAAGARLITFAALRDVQRDV